MRVLLVMLLLAVGCKAGTSVGPDAAPPPMAEAEMGRGMKLCEVHAQRVCACAERDPSMREACRLARARPEGLALHLDLLRGKMGPLNPKERTFVEAKARQAIAACVRADADLPLEHCPRGTE